MSHLLLRNQAIILRRQGKTYSEIKQMLHIPKSTLSGWLRSYPLSPDEIKKLELSIANRKYLGIEKIRNTKLRKRTERLENVLKEEKEHILPLTKRELYISGLMLYWGEGCKNIYSPIVRLNNTDPKVVKFFLFWLIKSFKISRRRIKVNLHLYVDMDVERVKKFWSKELRIPISQFNRPYIKESSRVNVNHKGFGMGTCGIYICSIRLKEKIMQGIEAIAENFLENKLAN